MQKTSSVTGDPGQTLTADLCDEHEDAHVIPGPFMNYGSRPSCMGPVEVISTQDDNSLVSATLKEAGNNRILLVDNSVLVGVEAVEDQHLQSLGNLIRADSSIGVAIEPPELLQGKETSPGAGLVRARPLWTSGPRRASRALSGRGAPREEAAVDFDNR